MSGIALNNSCRICNYLKAAMVNIYWGGFWYALDDSTPFAKPYRRAHVTVTATRNFEGLDPVTLEFYYQYNIFGRPTAYDIDGDPGYTYTPDEETFTDQFDKITLLHDDPHGPRTPHNSGNNIFEPLEREDFWEWNNVPHYETDEEGEFNAGNSSETITINVELAEEDFDGDPYAYDLDDLKAKSLAVLESIDWATIPVNQYRLYESDDVYPGPNVYTAMLGLTGEYTTLYGIPEVGMFTNTGPRAWYAVKDWGDPSCNSGELGFGVRLFPDKFYEDKYEGIDILNTEATIKARALIAVSRGWFQIQVTQLACLVHGNLRLSYYGDDGNCGAFFDEEFPEVATEINDPDRADFLGCTATIINETYYGPNYVVKDPVERADGDLNTYYELVGSGVKPMLEPSPSLEGEYTVVGATGFPLPWTFLTIAEAIALDSRYGCCTEAP